MLCDEIQIKWRVLLLWSNQTVLFPQIAHNFTWLQNTSCGHQCFSLTNQTLVQKNRERVWESCTSIQLVSVKNLMAPIRVQSVEYMYIASSPARPFSQFFHFSRTLKKEEELRDEAKCRAHGSLALRVAWRHITHSIFVADPSTTRVQFVTTT